MSAAGPTDTLTPTEEAVARGLARAALYRCLGAAFAYPVAGRFQELAHVAGMAAGAPTTPAAARAPCARFADAARDADPAAVAAEYVFLFDRQVRCPPYEGAYGAARGLAGKAAQLADVAGFYAAFGLRACEHIAVGAARHSPRTAEDHGSTPSATQPDMEDHVAAELEFMSALAVKEAYAVAEAHSEGLAVTRAAEATFLRDHLGCWATAFAAAVQAATPLSFYVAAAELLAAWVSAELEAFGVDPACAAEPDAPGDEEPFTCPMASSTGAEGGHP